MVCLKFTTLMAYTHLATDLSGSDNYHHRATQLPSDDARTAPG